MNIQERILAFSELLYQRSLELFNERQYRKAEITISAAGGASMFLSEDSETSSELKGRATSLTNTLQALLADVRRAAFAEYGERFLSGKGKQEKRIREEVGAFFGELKAAAEEAQRLASQ